MSKIKTHIFSFDRPAQLHLLLDSIVAFDADKKLAVTVQYCFSNTGYLSGYEMVISSFPDVKFLKETRWQKPAMINPFFGFARFNVSIWIRNKRFRYAASNFRELLISSFAEDSYDYCMFLTDDSLFYSKIAIDETVLHNLAHDTSSCYSLALGKNIQEEGKYEETGNWLCSQIDNDNGINCWKYPFAVDGRIYNSKFMASLLQQISFSNPNTFEALFVAFNGFKKVFAKIYANKKSTLVGFELNRVQQVYKNNEMGLDTEKINSAYLQGYRLNISFNNGDVNTFRPEIEKVFLKKNNEIINLYR